MAIWLFTNLGYYFQSISACSVEIQIQREMLTLLLPLRFRVTLVEMAILVLLKFLKQNYLISLSLYSSNFLCFYSCYLNIKFTIIQTFELSATKQEEKLML